jgi:hypothetical protein
MPIDTSGSKTSVQGIGSTVSYGKRYTLCALLNISTGDDTDGHQLGRNQSLPPPKQTITDERLKKAIEKIIAGEYSKERLLNTFELTDDQIIHLSKTMESSQ